MSTFAKLPHNILSRTDLAPAAKLVFAIIADRIGDNGEAWPGLRKLATDCGISPATAAKATKCLEAVGLIAIVHTPGNPGGQTNRYRLGECSDSATYQKVNVPKSEQVTYQKVDSERSLFSTEPDPYNQTHTQGF